MTNESNKSGADTHLDRPSPEETLGKIVAQSIALKADGTHYSLQEVDNVLGLTDGTSRMFKAHYPELWTKYMTLMADSMGVRVQAALLDTQQLAMALTGPAMTSLWDMARDETITAPTREKALSKLVDLGVAVLANKSENERKTQRTAISRALEKMDGLKEEIERKRAEEAEVSAEN